MAKYLKKVVVVIPVHTDAPSELELISFEQCFKVLGAHDIKIVAPKGLNLEKFKVVIPDFEVVYVNPIWQSSVEKYNKLKLSKFFYGLFDDYEYLLTYELDAFVFKDDLLSWCHKGYDYIGAPWFVGYNKPTKEFLGVGNSGFSLRNIRAMKRAIKKVCVKKEVRYYFGKKNKILRKLSIIFNYVSIYFWENHTIQNAKHLNEDGFIVQVISKKIQNFKIAPIDEAIPFAFEVNPKYLYQINQNTLPMGCHAWYRYDLAFWKPFIEDFGYKINSNK
ncbi:hypothetical protein GZ212_10205 [Mangrovimonas sp. CR14]|uniref:DUF5672 family protein n=1 Tax=Mangrovimonas sp. CR14 TaxID=2706120 RepID=UPI00141EB55C|nr:DUF5672 family protein [Mangrovimonas sp. CR14]NIK92520.1 hypothetical protein [Mangrovimonas sp. CR14]